MKRLPAVALLPLTVRGESINRASTGHSRKTEQKKRYETGPEQFFRKNTKDNYQIHHGDRRKPERGQSRLRNRAAPLPNIQCSPAARTKKSALIRRPPMSHNKPTIFKSSCSILSASAALRSKQAERSGGEKPDQLTSWPHW